MPLRRSTSLPLRRRASPPLLRWATRRTSPLLPGQRLAWADLHNHTLLSDGDGPPEDAYRVMREAGVDVAAVTDHAASGRLVVHLAREDRSHVAGTTSVDDADWARLARAADAADEPGAFVALRGFEWSSPVLGHVNVWGSQDWVDPVSSGATPTGTGPYGDTPEGVTMAGFHAWLHRETDAPFGLNHPGREPGRFAQFAHDPALTARLVGLEMFNRDEDYLFEGVDRGEPSPLVACLAAGWRPGLLGVSDHHGTAWGRTEGDGRTGLYLPALSREAADAGLRARRTFATREPGLRLAVTASGGDGPPVAMGGTLPAPAGAEVRLDVDLDRLPAPGQREEGLRGRRVLLQVLTPGPALPTVREQVEHRVPDGDDPDAATTTSVRVRPEEGDAWAVMRVVDPDRPADRRATGDLAAGRTLAYASPFSLDGRSSDGALPDGALPGSTAAGTAG